MKRRIMMLTTALAISLSPAAAQSISDWDEDQNGEITRAEFRTGFDEAGLFVTWDRNADDSIAEMEFAEGLYGFWDRNRDGDLSVEEWEDAVDLWIGEGDVDLSASVWDADGDGVISQFEFANAFQKANLIAEFGENEDDVFNEEELADALFDSADSDDDDLIVITEGGFFATAVEMLDDPLETDVNLIEAGEAFTQLPIPCGTGNDCQQTASNFCSVLGYGKPIDALAVDGQLYVVRCTDDPLN